MPEVASERTPQEVQQLTTAIEVLVRRVKAHFVLDEEKARNFAAASERRFQDARSR